MSARQLLINCCSPARDCFPTPARASRTPPGQGSSFLTGLGGGLGAGALGLLLGSKKACKIGGKVAMYGGMAALGALAYRAYGDCARRAPGRRDAAADTGPPARASRTAQQRCADRDDRPPRPTAISAPKNAACSKPNSPGFRRQRPQLARSRTGASAGSGGRRPGRRHARDGRRDVPGQPAGGRRRKLHGACLPDELARQPKLPPDLAATRTARQGSRPDRPEPARGRARRPLPHAGIPTPVSSRVLSA